MAVPVSSNEPVNVTPGTPNTLNTFVNQIRRAAGDISLPGTSGNVVNRLLAAEGRELARWSRLPHTPAGLSTFLHYNIAVVAYRFQNSPQAYLSTFTASLELVLAILKMPGPDGRPAARGVTVTRTLFNPTTENDRSVNVFDLEARRVMKFSAPNWQIMDFITLVPENARILSETLQDIYNPQRARERRRLTGGTV